jgi:hypothetical protein
VSGISECLRIEGAPDGRRTSIASRHFIGAM